MKNLLSKGDYFADFTESDNWDMAAISIGFIAKFNGYLNVTEEFDITQTIQRFKTMIID